MRTLVSIQTALSHFTPKLHPERRALKRSSVVLLFREGAKGAEVLMMKRAEREGDPWSGHMAFPGGRQDPGDKSIFATAVREVREEMGFDIEAVADHALRLSDIHATGKGRLQPMVVTPFVMFAHSDMSISPNYEVADYVWIPLQHFMLPANRETFEMTYSGVDYTLPCYYYKQFKVWGMSLMMLDELINALKLHVKD
jgi:8-oxo-dGTP pyrophosphatase MutT (NUDIX family)